MSAAHRSTTKAQHRAGKRSVKASGSTIRNGRCSGTRRRGTRYEDVDVHPHVVRFLLLRTPDIADYQVQQTARGIDVHVIAAPPPLSDLTRRLTEDLAKPDSRGLTCASRPARISHATPRPASCAATCRYPPVSPVTTTTAPAQRKHRRRMQKSWPWLSLVATSESRPARATETTAFLSTGESIFGVEWRRWRL